MEMPHRSHLLVGFLLVAVSLSVGCSDLVEAPVENDKIAPADVARSVDGTPVPHGAMERLMASLARQVAVAVNDQDLRHRVRDALHASSFPEGKLHFRTLVENDEIGLLQGMSAAGETTRTGIMASLDSVVDLEFYMPVDEHRAAWNGEADLLVVSFPDDNGSAPRGFDLAGHEVMISIEEAPSTPTLVLTPVETDFSSPVGENIDAQVAMSMMMPYADSAWIMEEAWVMDRHEPWAKGDPELEVHTWQEQPSGIVEDIICSGEHMPSPYSWDMNDAVWSGSVHLATQAILDTTVVTEFQMWEDDDGECNNNGGGKPPATSSDVKAGIEAALNLINEINKLTAGFDIQALFKAAGYGYAFASAFDNDDFVGFMLGPENACWPPREDGAARFVIRTEEGGSTKGDAMVDVTYGDRNPLCDLDVDIIGPDTVYNCDPQDPTPYPAEYQADVFGGDGSTITYEWREDGVISGTMASYQLQNYSVGTRRLEVHVDRGAEEDSDLLFVEVVQEDPEESEHCVA